MWDTEYMDQLTHNTYTCKLPVQQFSAEPGKNSPVLQNMTQYIYLCKTIKTQLIY